jgi:hypothetical protein
MAMPKFRAGAVAPLAAIALIAGCGSSTSSPSGAPSSSAPGTTSAAATSAAGAPQQGVPAAEAAQIKNAYARFFNGHTSAATAATLLQSGARFLATLKAQAGSSQAKALSARVTSVRPDPARPGGHVAAVRFTLLQNGTQLVGGLSGYAVQLDGHWLVAAQTFCTLLQLQSSAPSACHDASATALPSG